jgi:hypothetical protein
MRKRDRLKEIVMNRPALLATLLATSLLSVAATAPQPKATDQQAVRATVADYIEGYYSGDASRMERSLHPHYLKHTISESQGKLRITEKTGMEMVQEVRKNGPSDLPAAERKEDISVLDIAGDIASAKLVTSHWTDYMTLSKWNGEWKIVSVVLREKE